MGSVEIECPLCCNEVFTSYNGLKYHLLSIIDNLTCTACSKRFDRIIDLADHLGRECKDEEENMENTTLVSNKNIKTECIIPDYEETPSESILARALMKKSNPQATNTEENIDANENVQDTSKTTGETQSEDVYYCSSCATSFTSINEHLEKYHDGQEVYIEDDESSEPQMTSDEGPFLVIQNKETVQVEDSESEELNDTTDNNDLYNTLKQEEILDKNGRLYTRKVVQIEKFWDQNDKITGREPPITQKYILDNGKAVKLEGESIDVEEKNILNVHQCPHCSLHFCKMEQYYKHKCNPKENSEEYKCSKCDCSFFSARSLSTHMRTHRTEKAPVNEHMGPYICEICSTEFPTYKSLRLHKRMHDPVKVKEIERPVSYGLNGTSTEEKTEREMFKCQICEKMYDKQYEEVHMKSHSDEVKYDCEICNRKFYTQSNLEMHMRVHSNGKKFTCSYCKKGFLSYESLQEHVKHICQSRPYECQYCGRRFMRPHEKVKHERIHTGEKPHVCEICGKSFRVSYCLTLHMRTHSGTRPYQCAHCLKRFKAHSVYNHHLLTHSTVRNYKCPYCPKAFKTGVQLAGHKNSHIKPFTCTECNRPFASLYAVRAHMETHKRENNLKYSCFMCGASYARAFALRDHVKEHHSEEAWDKNADNELLETEYQMVAEGVHASNAIIDATDKNNILVVMDQEGIDNVEMVEEVATVN